MVQKLHEAIAVLKGVKTRVRTRITEIHRNLQNPHLMTGIERVYTSKFEDGDRLPPESKKVQMRAVESLKEAGTLFSELIDATFKMDSTNGVARADIIVDGNTLAKDVPAVHLLFLEKELTDFHTQIKGVVTLSEETDWQEDPGLKLWKSKPVETHRTKKSEKPIILYDATKEHPAQTKTIVEDIVEGYWKTVNLSGAIPWSKKQEMLNRISKLIDSVREARERANAVPVTELTTSVGESLTNYVLGTS